jgi:mono/diheme cytochrome c family protein
MRAKSPSIVALGFVAAIALLALAVPLAAQEVSEQTQVTRGGMTFRHYCRTCHGEQAHGDGPVAQYLTPKPANLTKIAERNKGEFPAEAVYAAIAGGQPVKGHGTSEMPVWGTAIREIHGSQSDDEVKQRIGELVAYLRSIQEPPPSR